MGYFKYDGSAASTTATPTTDFYGSSGLDTLTGTSGADSLWGGQGDRLVGGGGDDTYYLSSPADRAIEAVGGGVDKVVAWRSLSLRDFSNVENLKVDADKAYGAGDAKDNVIEGGAGAQQLYGGLGQDVLVGGGGADTFIVYKGEGNDVIQDFGADDVVRLKAGFVSFAEVQAHLTQVGADVKLDLGDGDGLIFRNITVSQLKAENFALQLDTSKLGAMTFHDEFSGPLSIWDAQSNAAGTWRPDYGYSGSQGLGSYTLASNGEQQIYTSPYFRDHGGDFSESPFVSNADGTLSIWARPSTNSEIFGYGYTSGLITTHESFSQTYGYFEMRADLPEAAGAWPAFWLLPQDGSWPPELDVMETLTVDPNAAYTTAHSGVDAENPNGGGHSAAQATAYTPDTSDGFHTYGVLWTATDLTWYIDGVATFHAATPADMNKPMYLLANLAMGGWGGAVDASKLPAEFKIDYIRAYSLGDLAGGGGSTGGDTGDVPGGSTGGNTGGNTGGGTTDPGGETGDGTTTPPPVDAGVVLTSKGAWDLLSGGAGADTLNAGEGYDTLSGGAGADVFAFGKEPWAPIEIKDFQLGVDRLDLSALLKASGYAGSDPIADKYVYLFDDGAGGAKVMFARDGAAHGQEWPNYIAHLDNVAAGDLTWAKLTGAVAPPPPASGGGSDTVTAPTTGLTLTSKGAWDVLTGGAGADTLNAGMGYDTLTGGAGQDRFVFGKEPWAPVEIKDFEVGVDQLDLSTLFKASGYTGSDPVADHYVYFFGDGDGGTKLMFDRDGTAAAQQWPNYIITLDHVSPTGLTWAKLTEVAGVTLTSKGANDSLVGGAGADTINAGQGYDVLTGAGGKDVFAFGKEPWAPIEITDFQLGSDKLDLSALFKGSGYAGSDPIADHYIHLFDDGAGGTKLMFDRDGAATAQQWPNYIIHLDNVAASGLTWAKLSGWVVA